VHQCQLSFLEVFIPRQVKDKLVSFRNLLHHPKMARLHKILASFKKGLSLESIVTNIIFGCGQIFNQINGIAHLQMIQK